MKSIFFDIEKLSEIGKEFEREFQTDVDMKVENEIAAMLDKCYIRLGNHYPKPENTLCINGVDTAPKGNLIAVTGHAKEGKSTTMRLITNILLAEEDATEGVPSFGMKGLLKNPTVLYADNEMHVSDTEAWVRKVHKLCGWNESRPHPRLLALNLVEYTPKQRMTLIEESVKKNKVDVAIIDNIRDFVYDFNNVHEVSIVMDWLVNMAKTYNIAIFCVLHQNKNDHSMRGHLGTELLNKCYLSLGVKKSDKKGNLVFILSAAVSRGKTFDDVYFTLDEEGMPIPVRIGYKPDSMNEIATKKGNESLSANRSVFLEIYAESVSMSQSYTELQNKWTGKTGKSTTTFSRVFKQLVDKKILVKAEDNRYCFNNE